MPWYPSMLVNIFLIMWNFDYWKPGDELNWFDWVSPNNGYHSDSSLSSSAINECIKVFLFLFYLNFVIPVYSCWADMIPCLPMQFVSNLNTLRPGQNGRHFPNIFQWIFLNENVWILLKISLKFVRKLQINNIPALYQIMAWRRQGDKPLSGPMMVWLLTHICVTRPQWVKGHSFSY